MFIFFSVACYILVSKRWLNIWPPISVALYCKVVLWTGNFMGKISWGYKREISCMSCMAESVVILQTFPDGGSSCACMNHSKYSKVEYLTFRTTQSWSHRRKSVVEMMMDLSQALQAWICISGNHHTLVEGSEQQDLGWNWDIFTIPNDRDSLLKASHWF